MSQPEIAARTTDKRSGPDDKVIPLFKVFMSPTAVERAAQVLQSGYIGQGPVVDEFEQALRARFEHDLVLTTNSCTSALHLALHLLKRPVDRWPGLMAGDEVLTTPLTCVATNWPILANRLRIKWVDVNEADLNLDLTDLEEKLSPTTKVVQVVHWGGNPVDLNELTAIQQRAEDRFGFRPMVVEDCAHAFGSRYKSRPLGSHGNIACFSFQAIKHLTCGDGGALLLPTPELYDRAKLLRWYGMQRNLERGIAERRVREWGFKFHMNDISAGIGLGNLEVVDEEVIEKAQANGAYYNENLADTAGVTRLSNLQDTESAYWLYTLRVDRREQFIRALADAGVASDFVHERNDGYECVSEFCAPLPTLDRIDETRVCIPCGWWVSEADRERIVERIKTGW